jgi:hypothetical protein
VRKRFVERRPPDILKGIRQLVDDPDADLERLVNALATAVAGRSGDADSDKNAFSDLGAKQRSELVAKFVNQRTALRRVCDDGYAFLAGSELAAVLDRRDVLASVRSS